MLRTDLCQDTPGLCKVCSSVRRFHAAVHIPEYVQFTTEQQDLALPSPIYLEISAVCCCIARMSGAVGRYRDLDHDDPFVTKVQSFDPVGFDFPAALHTRLVDSSGHRAAVTSE